LLRAGLDDADQPAAAVFGDFEIARREDGSFWELGRGAMGVTYLATDKTLHRSVALKVIETPTAVTGSDEVRERFLREARAAAALRHPNVAAVFQFGTTAGVERCYYAMELVEGETLDALMQTYLQRAAVVVRLPWRNANYNDFLYPTTQGDRSMFTPEELSYRMQVQIAATKDTVVRALSQEVGHLLAPFERLMEPDIRARVEAALEQKGG
jgi:hypothetical protein